MARTRVGYESSKEIKRIYNEYFARWKSKYHLGTEDLAQRCGVSAQYLGHISRSGRIPGKPILILLALCLELPDPKEWFRAAGINEAWPLEDGVGLRLPALADTGFISMHVDLPKFATAIRDIVRSELKPQSLRELLAGRRLRVGLNLGQSFLFGKGSKQDIEGFFPELIHLLALALNCEVEFRPISHALALQALSSGDIDVYGPIYSTASRLGQALYTISFCSVPMAALMRIRETSALEKLPAPKSIKELTQRPYVLAVHEDSMSQHFASSELGIPLDRIIPCKSADESIERIILSGISRAAHILLTDAPHAQMIHNDNRSTSKLLFEKIKPNEVPQYQDTLAVRTDWPVLVNLLNESLRFLERNGSIKRLRNRFDLPSATVIFR